MKLLVQPEDGVTPIIKALESAKESVDILIFRLDQARVERALIDAVKRGVRVRALIAWTNHGGEKSLRTLEMRLLAAGVTVARTADDLVRYHGKMLVIDRKELFLLAFNFTHIDIEHSRSFGVVTREKKIVDEALGLFEADMQRLEYQAGCRSLVVSPVNAREELGAFISAARRELLIYDQELSDPAMLALLAEKQKDGVAIRVIGKVRKSAEVPSRKFSEMRQHTRLMVRDGVFVFLGSQSLRALELDKRREVGIIFRDAEIGARLAKIFEKDWESSEPAASGARALKPARRIAKAVAKHVAKKLPPVAPAVDLAVQEIAGALPVEVSAEQLQDTVEDAVKRAVREVVRDVIEEVVADAAGSGK